MFSLREQSPSKEVAFQSDGRNLGSGCMLLGLSLIVTVYSLYSTMICSLVQDVEGMSGRRGYVEGCRGYVEGAEGRRGKESLE